MPRLRSVLPVLLGVALLGLLLWLADPSRLLAALRNGDPVLAAAALVPLAAVHLLEALRIAQLFQVYGLGYRTAVRITLASLFFGSFTPGSLGGEAYKVYFIQRRAPGLTRPIALTVLLRLAGIVATFSLAALYFLVYPNRISRSWEWSPSPAVLVAIGLLGLAGLAVAVGSRRVREALREIRPSQAAALALVSLLVSVARIFYFYLVARCFTPDLFVPDLAPVAAATLLAAAVPVTVGGLGAQEGALAAGLVLIGVPYPQAVAASLLNRGFLWAGAAAGWASLAGRR